MVADPYFLLGPIKISMPKKSMAPDLSLGGSMSMLSHFAGASVAKVSANGFPDGSGEMRVGEVMRK
jgi:hypothetical protein